MNKKTLVIYLAVAILLMAGIAIGVSVLYRNDSDGPVRMQTSEAIEKFPVLQAVPSDAAALLCAGTVRDGAGLFTDGTKAFDAFVFDGRRDAYGRFFNMLLSDLDGGVLSPLKSQAMAVSLHNSGSVVPLVVISVPKSSTDSTAHVLALIETAEKCGMKGSFCSSDNLSAVIASVSETLVSSSKRHLEEGMSILSNKDFIPALSGSEGKNVILLSNAYSSKLLPLFFQRTVSKYSDFIKNMSSWTVLSLTGVDDKSLEINGFLSSSKDGDHFVNVFEGVQQGVSDFMSVVPSGTCFAASLPLSDISAYIGAYKKFLDSKSRLGSYESSASVLTGKTGNTPEEWARSWSVREVVKAQWNSSDSLRQALFLRVGKKEVSMTPSQYAFSGYASALFGSLFSVPDESAFVSTGDWIVSGSESDVRDFADRFAAGDLLQSLLSDASVNFPTAGKACSFSAYFSAGTAPLETVFSSNALSSINSTLNGAAYEPCFLSCNGDSFRFDVKRVPFITRAGTPAAVANAVVEVPSGPFKVKNSGTGKTNFLSQQSNFYLTLQNEDGSGIWSIPFSGPLCGAVEMIDYYANGKIQFLFASGSRIYLLDRLGRFVTGFPVDLGKEILLGPSAFDFSGAKGYSVVVLHTDNTIGLYNIHGVKPDRWEGITSNETIIALPELIKVAAERYWAVRTASQTQIFPFHGGEPVYTQEGARAIRRDSPIEVTDSSLKVICNDGKTRNIKL